MEIGFINGIDNSLAEAKESAQYISKLAGGHNVHAVYNATHGVPNDLVGCLMGLNCIATEPIRQLHKMWNSFFEKASANAKFLMICHSQGAIHVRNALLDYPPQLRERILVVAIAPGGYIYRESCANVVHYRASIWRDPIPYLEKCPNIVHSRANLLRNFFPHLGRQGAKIATETIITLRSHPNAPWHDHGFTSPTYQEALQERIGYYLKSQGRKI